MVLTTKGADAKNLAKEYGRFWLSMYKFFCYIGDCRSAILVCSMRTSRRANIRRKLNN
jgi:hypothetical protein